MICYRIPTHPIIRHAIGRVTWHGIRQVATIFCIATPVWLVPAPGAPGVPEYVVPPSDTAPGGEPWSAFLPQPGGEGWGYGGGYGHPAPANVTPPDCDIPPIAISAVPHSDVPEPAGLAVLVVGLFVLRRLRS